MIKIHKNTDNLIEIKDSETGNVVYLSRGAAKAVSRFLLIELNCFEVFAKEGGPPNEWKIIPVHEVDLEYNKMIKKRWNL